MAEKRLWTAAQESAIRERSKTLLVSAAAGSGKTATLTERIIRALTDEEHPADLSRMLIVTFTQTAAGELRDRISEAVTEALRLSPGNRRLADQLLLLPQAEISTIDAFCRRLLVSHANEAGLSPDFRVSDEAETGVLMQSVAEALIERAFAGEEPEIGSGEEFCRLADHLVSSRQEGTLSDTLLALWQKTSGFPEGSAVFARYAAELTSGASLPPEKTPWGEFLCRDAAAFAKEAISALNGAISALPDDATVRRAYGTTGEEEIAAYAGLVSAAKDGYASLRDAFSSFHAPRLRPLKEEFRTPETEAFRLLRSSLSDGRKKVAERFLYPAEAWGEALTALGEATSVLSRFFSRFDALFTEEKRRHNTVSFHDLEHLTLSLLRKGNEITPLAREIAARYDAIYIDEYQDVNAIQHAIFESVSSPKNRFMVGDIKQSIYSFRLADPSIFASLRAAYPPLSAAENSDVASIFMSENFRCDKTVIAFVNAVFDRLFGAAGESIGYIPSDRLSFAKRVPEGVSPVKPIVAYFEKEKPSEKQEQNTAEEASEGENSGEASPGEAAWIAQEIARLIGGERLANGKRIKAGDITILLRSVKGKGGVYRQALSALGIPSVMEEKDSFFLNPEIQLALCLLYTVDNPRRDIWLAGLLLSPLFDFSASELAEIRLAGKSGSPLYDALLAYTEAHPGYARGEGFLRFLDRMREMAEGMPVDRLLRRLCDETGLLSAAGSDGTGGRRNLLVLYHYARTFEQSSFKGLYRFLSYLDEIIRENRAFRSPSSGGDSADAVRIMTMHTSKGLEFPVTFVAGCGRPLLTRDKGENWLFDAQLGLSVKLRDETGFARMKGPIFAAIAERNRQSAAEEELRILYVALTRARERLYVTGTMDARQSRAGFLADCSLRNRFCSARTVLNAGSYLSLVLSALGDHPDSATVLFPSDSPCTLPGEDAQKEANGRDAENPENGRDTASANETADSEKEEAAEEKAKTADREASAVTGEDAAEEKAKTADGEASAVTGEDAAARDTLLRRFRFRYPYAYLGRLPGKLSVSTLSPAVLDGTEDPSTFDLSPLPEDAPPPLPRFYGGDDPSLAAKRGTATHEFLQFCDLALLSREGVEHELSRLTARRFLTEEDAALVRREELSAFCRSPLFREMLDGERLWREFRFHVMLPASLFTADAESKKRLAPHRVLVQGVIDCLILGRDGSLTLADYKTDRFTHAEKTNLAAALARFRERHRTQLSYYVLAVREVFGRVPDRVLLYSLCLGQEVCFTSDELIPPDFSPES